MASFISEVGAVYARLGRCVVAMSEGVQDESGTLFAVLLASMAGQQIDRDAHGNVQLTGGDLGLEIQRLLESHFPKSRTRVDTFGYLPRGFTVTADPTDRREAHAVGGAAAETALEQSGSIALVYDGNGISARLVELDKVAARTRDMPDDLFNPDNTVSEEGRRYFRRLLPPAPDLFMPFV